MICNLRDTLHSNIHESNIPIKVLADRLGISYSYLANAGNPNLEDFHFQLRHLIPLTLETKSYAVLDHIEHAVGRVAFQIPELGHFGGSNFNEAVIETIEHLGELSRKYREFMADGTLTRDEARELEAVKFEIMKHVMGLLENITGGRK